LQHKAAADGNADGGHRALVGCHKAADDDVEAQQQIRDAVLPESLNGVCDQLLRCMREVGAHDLRREEENEHEQHRRKHTHGRERVAQELAAGRIVLLAVLVAHERLRALRHADHQVDDDGRCIGDDRIGHNAVRADAFEHRTVEEEDHQPRAELRHAIGQANGQNARVKARIEAELPQTERALFAKEVDKVRDTGGELGNACGDRRTEDTHVKVEDGDIVEHTVRQAPSDHRKERIARIAVRFDEHLEIVGYEVAHAERRDAEEIVLYIVERDLICAEEPCKRIQEEQHQRGDDRTDDEQGGEVLRKERVGLMPFILRDKNGDEG